MKGHVTWFSESKGYGFIRSGDLPGVDIFVHYTAVNADQGLGGSLKVGQVIEFDCLAGPKGPQALQVRVSK